MSLTFQMRDEFKRQAIAEKLIKLIETKIDISPALLDGAWGSGKTEFCQKMLNLMVEQRSVVLWGV